MKKEKLKKTGRRRKWPWLLIILFVLLCLIDSCIEPYWIEIREIEIRDSDIPQAFDGLRIAFLSDIHHGPHFTRERIAQVVAMTNALGPDLVLLGGDYIHQGHRYNAGCFAELAKLTAPLGVYGVLGNHDHYFGAWYARKEMEKNRIGLLDNKAFWLERREAKIKIGGVGDYLCDRQDIEPAIADVKENDFVMLVSHNPDFVEELETNKIDLVLSGHTHGGQVTLFGLFAPIIPTTTGQKYRTGVVKTGLTKVIISNGIGTISPPVRFFARPQIILVILKDSH